MEQWKTLSVICLASAIISLLVLIAYGILTHNELSLESIGILAFWLFVPIVASLVLSYISKVFWMAALICICGIIYYCGMITNGNPLILVFLVPVVLCAIASLSIVHMDDIE